MKENYSAIKFDFPLYHLNLIRLFQFGSANILHTLKTAFKFGEMDFKYKQHIVENIITTKWRKENE